MKHWPAGPCSGRSWCRTAGHHHCPCTSTAARCHWDQGRSQWSLKRGTETVRLGTELEMFTGNRPSQEGITAAMVSLTSGVQIALSSVHGWVFGRQLLVRPAKALCREDHAVTDLGELPQQLLRPAGQDHIIAGERQQSSAYVPSSAWRDHQQHWMQNTHSLRTRNIWPLK